MAIVSLKIGPKFYKFSCNDGQEMHMRELADTLDKRADQLGKALGFMPEGQLLAMICLLLAQEKHNLEKNPTNAINPEVEAQIADMIGSLGQKINELSENLK